MAMKHRVLWLALLATGLSGCEAALPDQNPDMAWVKVSGRAGYSLSASRLDGTRLNDARYVQLTPGRHLLELRLGYQRKGSDSSRHYCRIEIDYAGFSAGSQYDIHAVAMGHTVRAWLRDGQGERLVESRPARCGSQY